MLDHLRIPALVLLSALPIFSTTAGAVSAVCAGNSGDVLTTYFGVPFYSNGTCTGTWQGSYQCPEVVKRYSLHPDWHGNAVTYCDRDALRRRNLILVPNDESAPALNGDIVAFDGPSCGKGVGHVGLRCGARDADHWSLCDQNRTSRAANNPLELTRRGGAIDSFGTSCLVCGSSRPGWDFSDVEGLGTDTHGWTLTDLRLVSADRAAIRLDPGASAPRMLSPAGLRLNPDPRAGGYGRLHIFLRSSAGTRWLGVHFTTESDGAWDDAKAQFAAIPGGGGWNEVVVELVGNPRWVSGERIDQIRIDPVQTGYRAASGGVIEIDWMRFDR
jgi:hypothetical protein